MYKPKAIPAIRLPKQAELPDDEAVGRCMSQAQKMRGRVAELPWRSAMQNGEFANIDCVLAAIWHKDDEEPIWSFFKGDADPRQLRWRHQTRDLGLIAVLCQRECLGADADLESKDRLSAGNKRADSEPAADAPAPAPAPPTMPGMMQAPPTMEMPAFNDNAEMPFQAFPAMPGGMPLGGMGGGMTSPMAPMGGGFNPAFPTPDAPAAPPFPQTPGFPAAAANPNHAPAPVAPSFPETPSFPEAPTPPVPDPLPAAPDPAMGFAEKEKSTRKATMSGDLVSMKVPNLMQTLAIGKMSGLLSVTHNETTIEIFLEEGAPVHATTADCKGEAAIMELLTWEHGNFQLFGDEKQNERTVLKNLQNIMMESAPLMDQFRFLNQTGISLNSYLMRKNPNLSESEFEQRISRGAVTDLLKQKQFYQMLDNQSNLFEVLRKMPMSKMEWVPCVYNLVVCDLVAISPDKTNDQPEPIESTGVSRDLVEAALKTIRKAETGIINYPTVLHFLEQEFYRWEHSGAPFSILVFDMVNRQPGGIEPLSAEAMNEAIKRINSVKRNIDCLGHFETASFILLMPFTKVQAAALVARRIADLLWDPALGGALDSASLALAFGVAGVPEDCQDLGLLLAAAKQACTVSKQTATPVVAFQAGRRR